MLTALFEYLPRKLQQWLCGHLTPGHHYSMEMIRGGAGFVLDPLVSCQHCRLPLPQKVLDKLIVEMGTDDWVDDVEDLW